MSTGSTSGNGALSPVRRASLAVRAYEELKRAILSGELAPDSPLAEVELAEALGISRTPVREALAHLRRDGLVEAIHGGGNVVRRLDAEEVRELFLVREALESLAVREHAALTHSVEELQTLRKLIHAQRSAMNDDDVERFLDADEEFHLTICRQARLDHVAELLVSLRNKMRQAGLGAVTQRNRMQHVLREHTAILRALKARRPDAVAAMTAHLSATRKAFEASR